MNVLRASESYGTPIEKSVNFSGPANVTLLWEWSIRESEKMHTVVCAAGSRSHWHTHGAGQILVVVGGTGLVSASDGEIVQVGLGDLIVSDPGERHWHGAADTEPCTYVSISRGNTEWLGAG